MTSQQTHQETKDNVLYFSKSLELRAKAMQVARRARACPVGPGRNELRQIARSLKALADNDAWLNGRIESRSSRNVLRNARGA